MDMREGDKELLNEIARFEDSHDVAKDFRIGWSWRHVRIWPATLNRLFKDGYLENVFRSNSYTGYRLSELGRAAIAGKPADDVHHRGGKFTPPPDIFEDIIGHDDVKELLKACLVADRPVHVLLAGPPALAKTLFLWDIERACGERGSLAGRLGDFQGRAVGPGGREAAADYLD
jgi:Holliday junction DNA helicase RuvB